MAADARGWIYFSESWLGEGLVEAEFVAEGVDEVEANRLVVGGVEAGFVVFVVFGGEFGVEIFEAFHTEEDAGSGDCVAVVFGEVEGDAIAGDLEVEGEVVAEAVFPVDVEAEVIEIELAGLGDIKDAEDGDGLEEVEGHGWRLEIWPVDTGNAESIPPNAVWNHSRL